MIQQEEKQRGLQETKNTLSDCKNWLVVGMGAGFVLALATLLFLDGEEYDRLAVYSLMGGIAGYLLFLLKTMIQALLQGKKFAGSLEDDRAKLQITTTMEGVWDDFKYEEFEGQLLSRVTGILSCPDLNSLPWCHQKVREKELERIVRTEYEGHIRFYGHDIEEDFCRLRLGIYLWNEYTPDNSVLGKRVSLLEYRKGRNRNRISHRRDLFHMTVTCSRVGEITVESFWKE